jgi:hypothetical protein
LDVIESTEQMTLIAASGGITAGKAVKVDSNGNFALASVTAPTDAGDYYGIATNTAVAGQPVTAVRIGVVAGIDLSAETVGEAVFTAASGALTNTVGTHGAKIGHVIPVPGANPDGSSIKALRVGAPITVV